MKTILINGIIGWDLSAADVRKSIIEAQGDDLTIEINSPGGLVTDGIAIYNAIKNAPGQKTTRIVGLAASMASYIALATDRVEAEANAIYMIHNASTLAAGDHNDLRKAADVLEGMSRILSRAYTGKTGKPDAEIKKMMDAETFLFGDEILANGFADAIIGQADESKAESAKIEGRATVAMAMETLARVTAQTDIDQAAAMITTIENKTPSVAMGKGVAGPQIIKEVKKMTEEEFKALRAEAHAAGVQSERERVAKISAFAHHGPNAKKACDEAIAAGTDYMVALPTISAAATNDAMAKVSDNAPAVQTGTVATAGGIGDELTDEERTFCKSFGVTEAQYKAQKSKETE